MCYRFDGRKLADTRYTKAYPEKYITSGRRTYHICSLVDISATLAVETLLSQVIRSKIA